MRTLSLFILLFQLLSSGLADDNCGVCEMTSAQMVDVVVANATDPYGSQAGPRTSFAFVNSTFCGCPDFINVVLVNSTDASGRQIGPKIASQRVNFTYYASLDITKTPILVTDLDELGPNLAMVMYRINVNNTGNVNITGIIANDTLLGNYSLGKLTPGQNTTISPYPLYIITPDDVEFCWIPNRAQATGWDRCCQPVASLYAYANFPLGAKNLEDYLKVYSFELLKHGYQIKQGGDAEDLQDFEEKIRVQANRLLIFEDVLHGDFSHCRIPDPPALAVLASNASSRLPPATISGG